MFQDLVNIDISINIINGSCAISCGLSVHMSCECRNPSKFLNPFTILTIAAVLVYGTPEYHYTATCTAVQSHACLYLYTACDVAAVPEVEARAVLSSCQPTLYSLDAVTPRYSATFTNSTRGGTTALGWRAEFFHDLYW